MSVSIRTSGLSWYSHQSKLDRYISTTDEIYEEAVRLVDEMWDGEPVRLIGVQVSGFADGGEEQMSIFDTRDREKDEKLENAISEIRKKYGTTAVIRGPFANNGTAPIRGGVNDGKYIMMGGYKNEDN